MTKKFKHIDQESFDSLKAFANAKLNPTQIRKITGVSFNTYAKVKVADTLEEYKILVAESNKKRKEVKEIKEVTPDETNTLTLVNKIVSELGEIRRLLAEQNGFYLDQVKSKKDKWF